MVFLYTLDERYYGTYTSSLAGSRDAPGSIYSTTYTLAEGILNTAYGALVYNFSRDDDAYSLGTLLRGKYTVSASGWNWDFFNNWYGGYTPSVYIYNASGALITTGYAGSASFTVTTSGDYYAVVEGGLSSSEYELYYTKSSLPNSPATINASITGGTTVGSTLSLTGTYYDADGTSTSLLTYAWATSRDGLTWTTVGTQSTYIVKSSDAGKYIDIIISFVDDAGFSEVVSPAAIFIQPTNTAPTSSNGVATIQEDQPFVGYLPASADIDGDPIVYAKASNPSNGTAAISTDGSLLYSPNTNFFGTDTFTFTVSDGKGGSNTYTQTITVTAVNDAPVVANGSASTAEDTQLSASVPVATDVDSASLTYSLVGAATNGTVVLNANGSYTYTPKANFGGSDSFTYRVSDGQANSNTATVSLTITAVNDAPVVANAIPDQSATAGTALNFTFAANAFTDVETANLSYAATRGDGSALPSWLTFNQNTRTFSGTPSAADVGSLQVKVTASDGSLTANDTFALVVNAQPNAAPTGANGNASTAEDTPLNGQLPAATDANGDTITYARLSDGAHGTVTVGANGSYTYTPAANYAGPDAFTFTVSDGKGGSNTYTQNITITAVNDAPVAASGSAMTVEDAVFTGSVPAATDVDSSSLTYGLVSGPANGTLTLNANGSYSYRPNANFAGSDSFTYLATDGQANSNTATFSLTVTGTNDTPVLATPLADQAAVAGSAFAFTVAANSFADVDGDSLSYTATRGDGSDLPSWLTFNQNTRSFSGTPSSSDVGSLEVRVRASDGEYNTSDTFVLAIADGQPKPVPGDSGNNALRSTSANEGFDGGAGVDSAKFQGSASQYRFTQESGKLRVSDTTAGRDGSDTLLNIERVEFADMTLNLTVDDTARTIPETALNRIADLYVAFFNRVPDGDGMEYWIGQYRQGKKINDIAEAFYNAGVFFGDITGYRAGMTDVDFINVVYRNVLGRPEGADQGGQDYWTKKLRDGSATKGTLVSDILDAAYGPAFSDPTNPFHWVQKLLYNKLEVAKQVALAWGVNYNSPEDSISKGMAIAAAVTPDSTTAAITLVGVDLPSAGL